MSVSKVILPLTTTIISGCMVYDRIRVKMYNVTFINRKGEKQHSVVYSRFVTQSIFKEWEKIFRINHEDPMITITKIQKID